MSSMGYDGKERRAHPRVPYGAWVTVEREGRNSFYLARNLSLGGILLEANDAPPPIDSEVRVLLVIEGEREPLPVYGTVVRHDAQLPGFAVKFDSMTEEAATRLLTLVQRLGHDAGGAAPGS